jgi:hypothetical protein
MKGFIWACAYTPAHAVTDLRVLCRIPDGRAMLTEQNVTEVLIHLCEHGSSLEIQAEAGLLLEAASLREAESNTV